MVGERLIAVQRYRDAPFAHPGFSHSSLFVCTDESGGPFKVCGTHSADLGNNLENIVKQVTGVRQGS